MAKLGLTIGGPYATLGVLAGEAEKRRFDSVWVAEADQDSLVQASVVATATEDVEIGTNITLAFPRSPEVTAQAAWDLNELTSDRFIVGLGSQVRRIVEERFSAEFSQPAKRMGEYVQAMQAAWAMMRGEDVTFDGDLYHVLRPGLMGLGRAKDRQLPRVYVAAVGPRMTQTAATFADGMLGHPFVSREYLTDSVLPRIEETLAENGRDRSDFQLAQGVIVSISDDRDQAIRDAKAQIAFYGSTPNYRQVFEAAGDGELQTTLNHVFKASNRDADAMIAAVPDEAVQRYAFAGTPDEVKDRLLDFGQYCDTLLIGGPWFKVGGKRMAENVFAILETFGR